MSAAAAAGDGAGGTSAIRTAERTYRLVLGEGDRLDTDEFLEAADWGAARDG